MTGNYHKTTSAAFVSLFILEWKIKLHESAIEWYEMYLRKEWDKKKRES